jgi:hypothetical protein
LWKKTTAHSQNNLHGDTLYNINRKKYPLVEVRARGQNSSVYCIANKAKITNSIENHDNSVEGDFGKCHCCTYHFVFLSVNVIQSIWKQFIGVILPQALVSGKKIYTYPQYVAKSIGACKKIPI